MGVYSISGFLSISLVCYLFYRLRKSQNKKPSLFNDYMTNARTGHLYDFKYSNGTINTVDDGKDIYRGMPIGITGN